MLIVATPDGVTGISYARFMMIYVDNDPAPARADVAVDRARLS
jgi:hypothetical protein